MELFSCHGHARHEPGSASVSGTGDPRMLLVRGKGDKERMKAAVASRQAATAVWLKTRDEADAAFKEGTPRSKFLVVARQTT
jgi:integrase/recombinase XerD